MFPLADRRKVLRHHPDKKASAGGDGNDDSFFKCIAKGGFQALSASLTFIGTDVSGLNLQPWRLSRNSKPVVNSIRSTQRSPTITHLKKRRPNQTSTSCGLPSLLVNRGSPRVNLRLVWEVPRLANKR